MTDYPIRPNPCAACPYRRDVPSGVWSYDEYEKLRGYDALTGDQPFTLFMCHATPDQCCNGWAVVHSSRGHDHDLLALRLFGSPPIPETSVEMWESGNVAADHGQADIEDPSDEAIATTERLRRRYERLR